jgi:hypothetical protein
MGNIINIYNKYKNVDNKNFGLGIEDIDCKIIHVTEEEFKKLENDPRGIILYENLSLSDAKYKSNNIKNKFKSVYIIKIIY